MNENLHKHLRCYLQNRNSLSPQVLVALLHSYIFARNCRLSGIKPMESSLQACLNKITQPEQRPAFGLPFDVVSKTIDDSQYFIAEQELADIVQKATDLLTASEKMPKISTIAIEDQVLACEFRTKPACNSESDMHEHYKLVDGWLMDAQLKRVTMPSDGNCLFSTIAYLLKNSKLSQKYRDFLTSREVDITSEIEKLAMVLRKCAVEDLQENYCYYSTNLNDMTFEKYMEGVEEFKNEGCFAGDLGDLQVIAIANALRTNINFVSSSYKQPFQHIHPRDSPLNEDPFSVAFICFGPGHYDAVLSKNDTEQSKKTKQCVCGRKGNAPCVTNLCPCVANKVSCGMEPCCRCNNCQNKYGTRASTPTKRSFCGCGKNFKEDPGKKICSSSKCPCFMKGRACKECSCKFCSNKYGNSDNQVKKGTRKMTEKKTTSMHSKKFLRQSSSEFLTDNDFSLKPLRWSLKETVLLRKVMLCKKLSEPYNIQEVTAVFNTIIKKNPNMGLSKTDIQVQQKMAHMKKVIDNK